MHGIMDMLLMSMIFNIISNLCYGSKSVSDDTMEDYVSIIIIIVYDVMKLIY